MRNELVGKSDLTSSEGNKIELVLQKSKETSLLRFERQIYHADTGKGPGGWYPLLAKSPGLLNNEQFAVFKAVHQWRDEIARKDDDSTAFVMPNHVIFTLAKVMPVDMIGLLGAVHPISHSVKSRAGELLELIKAAKENGRHGPSLIDILQRDKPGTVVATVKTASDHIAAVAEVTPVDQGQLRSESSSFWGGAFGSSLWDSPSTLKNNDSMRLAIPLPGIAAEEFDYSQELADRSRMAIDDLPTELQELTPSKKQDEAFVIKRGSKRKSESLSDEEADQRAEDPQGEYDIVLDEEEAQEAREKAERKARRKAEKKLAKKAKAQHNGSNGSSELTDDDEEPFDYSKAASVLHSKKNTDQGSSKQKKPFDPYQKSSDAPKGMRRLQTERPGKSFTFKS